MSDGLRYVLAAPGEAERAVRRSRFWAYAGRVDDDGEALRTFLARIRERHRDAGHVVYAWRGEEGRSRGSDDGEPYGTGLRPCMDALERAGLVACAVAVARVFGGVLLGVGGLSRAYGETANAAIAAARRRPLQLVQAVTLAAGFSDESAVQRLTGAFVEPPARQYVADGVRLRGEVDASAVASLRLALEGATAGRACVREEGAARWR